MGIRNLRHNRLATELAARAAACCLIVSVAWGAAAARGQEARSTEPVILLTGFEPFGKERPPNPSWEGIKKLDGQKRNGYRLVSKQLPVTWGAPLAILPGLISQYRPVAILSFGQGGLFTIESTTSNTRCDEKDNLGQTAPSPSVVSGGPAAFRSAVDCLRLARLVSQKRFPVYVSVNAGQYLCDECLYSLEYLKSAKKIDAAVLFCHVPPLGTKLRREKIVDADYVQSFVEAVIDSWCSMGQEAAPVVEVKTAEQSGDRDRQEVKQFVEGYFRSWSNQDMDAYGQCFSPEACIQFIDSHGRIMTRPQAQFVAEQREYHRMARVRATEVPKSIDIRFEARLARAVVYWHLTAGARQEFGYDHFTLVKNGAKWQILNLVFYEAKPSD